MKVLPILIYTALLAPGPLAGEVVPVTRQFEVMPPQSSPWVVRESYISATAVDLGAAGFAVGWDLDIFPFTSEDIKGITEGRQVLRGGRPAERFEASTDVFIPGSALDISLAAAGKTGRFVAVWSQLDDFFSGQVWFRRFANGYQPLDPGAVPATESMDGRVDCHPAVAANAGGSFVVAWQRGPSFQWDEWHETTFRTLARVFAPDGHPLTPEITVTEPVPAGPQSCYDLQPPVVGMDAAGNFVVLGSGAGPLPGIWGRRYDPAGQPLGEPFQVSAREGFVTLAMSSAGDFVAAWTAPFQRDITLLARFGPDDRRTGRGVRVPGAFQPALAMDGSGRVALFWIDGRRPALAVFDASLARLGPVVFDPPASLSFRVGVAFTEDRRILTVWVGPRGPKAADSILGRIWQVR